MADFTRDRNHDNGVITSASDHSIVDGTFWLNSFLNPSAWPAANTAIFIPFVIGASITIAQIFFINGATASGNVDVGIYDAEGNRLVSSGSTAQSGTTVPQTINITDTVLPEGLYYMALSVDNTTATLRGVGSITSPRARLIGVLAQASAFPLPATATWSGSAETFIPFIGLTTQTVV